MGWGTFAAGQALRWTREAGRIGENSTYLADFVFWLNNKFLQSYIRRVLQGTVIMHPSVWDSVDLDYWEEAITKRAARDWRLLMMVQIVVVAIGVSTFWLLLFLYVPGFWYYGKNRLIKMYSNEINKEFEAEGFNIPKLTAEIPSLLEDERQANQVKLQRELKRQEEEDYRRKFGKKKG